MYKYETHMHTAPVSRCGRATIEESLAYYKELGYDGVFVTNHFLGGNINIDKDAPYAEKIEFYFSDYEKGVQIGKQLGIKVFSAIELPSDFLVYGLDKDWFLEHPEIMDMKKSEQLSFLMEHGALIIHAHPFREASYIDHIHLYPRHIHGVEILNSSRPEEENSIAKLYCTHYGLIEFAGSDNHHGAQRKNLAGMCCEEPICDVQDFIDKVKTGKAKIFTLMEE